MAKRLAAASGALIAAAAIAGSAVAHAEDFGGMPEPMPPQASPADVASPELAGQPAQATQVSSVGTSVGSSMAMMLPMMAMYAPMMALPMLTSGLGGLSASAQEPAAAAAVDLSSALGLTPDLDLTSGVELTPPDLDLAPLDLTPDLDLGAPLDLAAGLDLMPELDSVGDAVSAALALFGF